MAACSFVELTNYAQLAETPNHEFLGQFLGRDFCGIG